MSCVSYQFVTATSTSWTHEFQCDACKLKVTRVGELPKRENDKTPRFEHGALAGWASFSMRSTRPPPDQLDLDQDEWSRLDRDLCPSCAVVVNDWLCSWGADIGRVEERYLDALGRPTEKASPTVFGPGIELCDKPVDAYVGRCARTGGHAGDCSAVPDLSGREVCPVCIAGAARRRLFTRQELESHAVDQHSVRYSDGTAEPIGWYTERGWGRTYYPDVEFALRAERP